MNWRTPRPTHPEVTTILRDGSVTRQTGYGTTIYRKPAPPLEMDADMRGLFDSFGGKKKTGITFADMEGDAL